MPVRAVGLYVPAGSAPLPSTAVMLAVPAAIAGCPLRVMCTAPNRRGGANPAVLVAARKAGVDRVFKLGGAQAIAAMAYGTASIPKCDKLFGPGNATCTRSAVFTATQTVNGNGTYRSPAFAPLRAGTYRWVATYSGDANNASAATGCGARRESGRGRARSRT